MIKRIVFLLITVLVAVQCFAASDAKIDTVAKYGNETAFFNRMAALGVPARQGATGNGDNFSQQERFPYCTGGVLTDINGDNYMPIRLLASDADKIPNNDQNPAFTIIWRSDEWDTTDPENPVLYPYPEAEVYVKDIDGNITGTRRQSVGRIL